MSKQTNTSDFRVKFSQQLKWATKWSKLKQKDIANAIGVSAVSYSKYLSNEATPTIETIVALADFLNISLDDLVGRKGNYTQFISEKETRIKELQEELSVLLAE